MTVDFPPMVVWRSKAQTPKKNEWDITKPPKYGSFQYEPRLRVLDIFMGSSVAGQSYAKLAIASGDPVSKQVDPENADEVLSCGDRIAMGFREGSNVRWRFAGYVTIAAILIQDDNEQLTYKVVGPEWPFGDPSAPGANCLVFGQVRRSGARDDSWSKSKDDNTSFDDLLVFNDARCVFNDDGHANMSTKDSDLMPSGSPKIKGRVFEESDRKLGTTAVAEPWNILQAVKLLCTVYNHPLVTNIQPPRTWTDEALPFTTKDPIRPSDPNETGVDVDGLGLWPALAKLIHPRFAFYVDPTPSLVQGDKWGTFPLIFFSRGELDSRTPIADLWLNKRGTSMEKAVPSVSRIEAARDTSKIVNKFTVAGKRVAHVRLIYWGKASNGLTEKQKKTALQTVWSNNADKLSDYAGTDDNHNTVVSSTTIDKNAGNRDKYQNQYITTGELFTDHADAFRRFAWNEAGEFDGLDRLDGGTVIRPDISDVVAVTDEKQRRLFVRRRRPMMDCAFQPKTRKDTWHKQPPTLYMAIAKSAFDKSVSEWKWREISAAHYDLDKYRAAIRFTADNLVDWKPFAKDDKDGEKGKTPKDQRNFLTLLNAGLLRMCLEGTVEMDTPLMEHSDPGEFNGTPHLRQFITRGENTFLKTEVFDDGLTSPSKLIPLAIDKTDEASAYASKTRQAGEQQSIHASIIVEGDWPMQIIGSVIQRIKGREIILTSNAKGGRGAQIVAVKLDVVNGYWEYLTESAALALQDKDRRRFASGTKIFNYEQQRKPVV
jgi:hypothetical protein